MAVPDKSPEDRDTAGDRIPEYYRTTALAARAAAAPYLTRAVKDTRSLPFADRVPALRWLETEHLARTRQQVELRAPTAPGGIRVDQIHVTGNLTDAITDYQTYSAASDHDAIVATLNLARAGAPTPWI